MTAKEYLKRVKKIDNLINVKLKEIERLREFAISVSGVNFENEKVQGGKSDKIGNAVAKIIDMTYDLERQVNYFIELKKRIAIEIDMIDNADYINVLYKRYFEYKGWEQIAVDMNYTMRWVQQLHGKALKEFIEIHSLDML